MNTPSSSASPPGIVAALCCLLLLSLASCHANDHLRTSTATSRAGYPKTVPQKDAPLFPGLRKSNNRREIATRHGERRPFTRESATASSTSRERNKSSRSSHKSRPGKAYAKTSPRTTRGADAAASKNRATKSSATVVRGRSAAGSANREDFASEEEWLRHGVETVAESYIGTPYHYGGTTPEGFDCSGFTRHILQDFGIGLNRVSMSQAKQGSAVDPKRARPGDLVYFANGDGRVNHVGIVVANGRDGLEMVHASSSQGIVRDNVTGSEYWSGRLAGARCVVECRADGGLQASGRR